MATLSTKLTGDPFASADYNRVVQALREVLGVTDDGQAYIDLGEANELRIDNAATTIKHAGGQLYFNDAVAGSFPLSRLGGDALQEDLFFGNVDIANPTGLPWSVAANTVYLQAIYVPRAVSLDHFMVWDGFGGLSAICGIYNTAGVKLVDTGSFALANDTNTKKGFNLYALAKGSYYIAIVVNNSGSMDPASGANLKSVAAGGFTLPDPIVIPGGFVDNTPCFGVAPSSGVAWAI